jgi:hypothetical protein
MASTKQVRKNVYPATDGYFENVDDSVAAKAPNFNMFYQSSTSGPQTVQLQSPKNNGIQQVSTRGTKRVNMALAAYTSRLCNLNCFNKNGLFGRDKNCSYCGRHRPNRERLACFEFHY